VETGGMAKPLTETRCDFRAAVCHTWWFSGPKIKDR
jgi:hypothetical protein